MKKGLIATIVGLLVAATGLPAATAHAAPYCGITWGSLPKSAASYSTKQLTNIRTGQHACYDRMVLDMNGAAAGYDVRYVSNVYADGSGQLITLTGGAKLQVVLKAPAYNPSTGTPTYPGVVNATLPGVNLTGYQTFKSAKFAGSFEGQTTVGVGVRAQLPFRVMKDGNKVIIDVAHKW